MFRTLEAPVTYFFEGMGDNVKGLRIFFFVCLAVWLGGAVLTYQYASPVKQITMVAYGLSETDTLMMNIRGICINLFGPLAIGSGLILLILWGIRKFGKKDLAQPVQPNPETIFRAQRGQGTRVDFSKWLITDNTLSKRFIYKGDLTMTLYAQITVELSTINPNFPPMKFVNFFVEPPMGIEGAAKLLIVDRDSQKSAGWVDVRTNTTNDNSTIINVQSRPDSDAVFEALTQNAEYEMVLKRGDETFAKLPLPSEEGLSEVFKEVATALRL